MGKRILFVDDDIHYLNGLRRQLKPFADRMDIILFTTADEAVLEARENSADVIVCDLAMPEMDGFALLHELAKSEQTRGIPVIIVTGSSDRESRRKALDYGATDLLSKPVDIDDLLARIRSALRLKEYQDQLKQMNQALESKIEQRTIQLEHSRLDVIWCLAKAGEYRDKGTGNHVVRVGYYSRILAEGMGLPRDFTRTLFLTSPLHDIGKIGIPDAILLKQGRLTPDERKLMQRHCEIGAEILLHEPIGKRPYLESIAGATLLDPSPVDSRLLQMGAIIARTHHERWDGGGYPQGLTGEEIPLESRIVAVADVYDALRSARPYKPAYSEQEALEIMRRNAPMWFDPEVFATFENMSMEFQSIRTQYADNAQPLEFEEAA